MIVSLIVAMGKNRVLGKNNTMLWHLPAEFQHFKKTTMGRHLIMGRKTFESVKVPLPGRTTIIVTRKDYAQKDCLVAHSLEEAITMAQARHEQEVFICGGGEIYAQSLQKKLVDRMYLTIVDYSAEGDTYFPEFDRSQWKERSCVNFMADEKNAHPWKLYILERDGKF